MVRKIAATPRKKVSRNYDVVLRGTFEARFIKQTGTSPTDAKDRALRELKSYAAEACNGGNTIVVDNKTSEAKAYVPKYVTEVLIEAKSEDEVRKKMQTIGDGIVIREVYKERVY